MINWCLSGGARTSPAASSVTDWLLPPCSSPLPLPDHSAPAVLKLHTWSLQEPPPGLTSTSIYLFSLNFLKCVNAFSESVFGSTRLTSLFHRSSFLNFWGLNSLVFSTTSDHADLLWNRSAALESVTFTWLHFGSSVKNTIITHSCPWANIQNRTHQLMEERELRHV